MKRNALSIADAAADSGDATALVVDGQRLSFRALEEAAARVGAWLAAAVDDREEAPPRIALVCTNRLESVVVCHACWRLGWTPVLIHPRSTANERERLLRAAAPALVVDEAFTLDALGDAGARITADRAARGSLEELPAAVLFTSGTSGTPKGAILSHRAFIASARASEQNLGWLEGDRWLLSMPLAHVGGLSVLTRTLLARKAAILTNFRGADPHPICEVIARERATIVSFVPTMLARLFESEPDYRFPSYVRAVLLGGAPAPASLLEEARIRGVPLLTTYGLTEACSQVTTQRYGTRPGLEQGAGHPLPGLELRIVEGEIQVRGPNTISGYLFEERRPFSADGWFQTGDHGSLDAEGRLHVRGRRSDLIVTGGENVYPFEVEQALERWPEIARACVFGVPDEIWGETVACAVVLEPAARRDREPDLLARLEAYLRDELAPHKRPRRVAFVESIEVGPGGKVDRRATADLALPRLTRLGPR